MKNKTFSIKKNKSQYTNSYSLLLDGKKIADVFSRNGRQFKHFAKTVKQLQIKAK